MEATACAMLVLLAGGLLGTPAAAPRSFYLVQIERVIGGVFGDTSAQAIQLRFRFPEQPFPLQYARLRAWDAAGANPVTLVDFDKSVPNGALGAHALIASSGFADHTHHPLTPDFTMTDPIPESYLAAGRITYESDTGTIYWMICYGGANYTGPTTGSTANDANGDFGPPVDGPLPTDSTRALYFKGRALDRSTSNLADYALTPRSAVFTNNAGESAIVTIMAGTPAVSQWGMAVIALLLLTGGSVVLMNRRRSVA